MNLDKIKIINPLHDLRWDIFVSNHPHGRIYHHSSWMKAITLTYKQVEPLCVVLENENSSIRSAIPCFIVKSKLTGTRIVCLPFTSYCNPLLEDRRDFTPLLDAIIKKLEEISASYFELRILTKSDLFKDERLKIHNYEKIHILNLEDGFEKIQRAFPRDIVYSKKRAVKSGVKVRHFSSEQDLKDFYFIHAMTRKRQGFPVQPYAFLKNMFEIMHPQNHFAVLLAELNGKAIAGMVLLKFKDTVSFEIGASIPEHLAIRPNHLLVWRAIERACSDGYHYFDFGKTPPENKGLMEFKRRWGAEVFDVPYFYYPEIKGVMSLEQRDLKHRLLMSVGRHMPLGIAKAVGRVAYHHLG